MDLLRYRMIRKISQQTAAKEFDFSSKGTISALETGAYKTSVKTALRIYEKSGRLIDPKTLVRPEEAHLLAGIELRDGG